MKKLFVVVALFAIAPVWAYAADDGLYLEANIGAAKYTNADPFPNPGKFSGGIGYKFNRYFAADLGMTIFGDSTVTGPGGSATLKLWSIHPAVVGILPLNERFSVYGKLGFASNHASGSNTLGASLSETQTAPYLGLGFEVMVNPKIGGRAQYENYGKFASGPPDAKASAISIGIIAYLK